MKQSCIISGTVCACARHPVIDPHGYHYLECGEGGHILSRHNHLQTVGDQCARTAGHFSTTRGLRGLLPFPQWQNNRGEALVPDQKIHEWSEDGRHMLADYNVCHPCASSYVAAASREQLKTAERSEREKVRQYEAACQGEGYAFSPIVFESFGAFGASATTFLDRATDIIRNELPEGTVNTWSTMSFRSFYAQRFSVALQRGNARAIRLRATRDMRVDGQVGVEPPAYGH